MEARTTFTRQFTGIAAFLQAHQYLHEKELLRRYPDPLPDPYREWEQEMRDWSVADIARFETELQHDNIRHPAFLTFVKTIKSLAKIPISKITPVPLPPNIRRGMTPKKIHEIERLTAINGIEKNIIDIGGGKGFLSAAILQGGATHSTCIDMDITLQSQGKKRLQKWLPELTNKIAFLHKKIDEQHPIPSPTSPQETTLFGLHSCGNLSSQVIRQGIDHGVKQIINFGCCYHHLKGDYNLSGIAKEKGLQLSQEALHLAAHSHRILDTGALQKRQMVKRFRYALHCFLYDRYGIPFQKIGDGKAVDYQDNFPAYAKKFALELSTIPDAELDAFFQQKTLQDNIGLLMRGDSLRNILGRLIELYIVLDRCLFLKENGYRVTLTAYFDRQLSPRNLGIVAKKDPHSSKNIC